MISTPPLLAISEGRRVRPRKAPVFRPRESKLHAAVAKLLTDHCLPEWRWRHLNAKSANAREGAIMKKLGVRAGWPDFILISPGGAVRFLELKRDDGEEPSDAQIEFRMWCIAHGVPHVIAWTMAGVLEACYAWDCLRIKYEDRL